MNIDTIEFRKEMKQRTKVFALRVIRLFQALQKTTEAAVIGKQLLRQIIGRHAEADQMQSFIIK